MNIAIVTESYWPNIDGGAVFERHLAHQYARLSHDVTIYSPSPKSTSYVETDHGTSVVRLRSFQFPFQKFYHLCLWPQGELTRALNQNPPDIIHSQAPSPINLIALRWAKRHNVPVISTNHFIPENFLLWWPIVNGPQIKLSPLVWKVFMKFYNQCNFVTSPTPTGANMLTKNGLKAPHDHVSNGIDTERFVPRPKPIPLMQKYGIPQNKPVVLYTGRVDGEKRLDVWLKMIPLVLAHQDCHFVIGGNGTQVAPLKKLSQELGIADHLTFTGFLNEDEFPQLYNCADVFCITSPVELQSIVTLEAIASGLPIVACELGALKELVHDDQNGYLCRYQDSADTAARILQILSDKHRQKAFGLQSRTLAQTHSFDQTVSRFLGLYQEMISHKTPTITQPAA